MAETDNHKRHNKIITRTIKFKTSSISIYMNNKSP